MKYRKKLSRGRSRKVFNRGNRVNRKNYRTNPMRGGIRM